MFQKITKKIKILFDICQEDIKISPANRTSTQFKDYYPTSTRQMV